MPTRIINAHLVSPDLDYPSAALEFQDGRITAVYENSTGLEGFDLRGNYLLPGFFDIHTHGCNGFDFSDGTLEAVHSIAVHKLSQGVTSFLGTTLTLSEKETTVAVNRAVEYMQKYKDGAKINGIHLEGPFFSRDCAGAQNPDHLQLPNIDFVDNINQIMPVKKVSYSIELDEDLTFVEELSKRGIMPAAAHTNASYEQFKFASAKGLKHFTHFCNVMTPLHHLRFGLVGAGLLHKDIFLEIICDGIHLCPEMIQLIFTNRSCDHIMLITDSIRAAGMPDGNYTLGGLDVVVKNGCARIASGAVAGSTMLFYQGLQHVQKLTSLPLKELVKTTAWNQARSLNIPDLGKLEKGYLADMVCLDKELQPLITWVEGKKLFEKNKI